MSKIQFLGGNVEHEWTGHSGNETLIAGASTILNVKKEAFWKNFGGLSDFFFV
jgi:hypothetical protein